MDNIKFNATQSDVLTQAKFQKIFREYTQEIQSIQDKQIIKSYLIRSGKILESDFNSNGQNSSTGETIKIYKIQSQGGGGGEVGFKNKDRALAMIEYNIEKLNQKLLDLEQQLSNLTQQAKSCVKNKRLEMAKFFLAKKKKFEKSWQHLSIMKLQLQEQKVGLSGAQANQNVLHALKLANQVNKSTNIQLQELEKVFDEIQEQKQNQIDITNLVSEKADESFENQAILKELEDMNNNSPQNIKLPSVPNNEINPNVGIKVNNKVQKQFVSA